VGVRALQKFMIIFYDKPDGTEPVQDFLDSLDYKMLNKMLSKIRLLREKGNLLREPHLKYLRDGIFELRAQVGTDISRVLYFFFIGNRAIITNGFIKKTQESPPVEIELAKKYRSEFFNRKENKQ